MSREKVLAAVVRLLETTLIRVGNDEYARLNRSFGLTTLKSRHATVTGTQVRFRFRGKSGRQHEVGIRDRRLATVVRRCQDLPGQELFQYVGDDGEPHDVASDDVNDYLREISGIDITAKDFRTWAGTVLAYRALRALAPGTDDRSSRKNVVEAVRLTSDRLGNTPAVARRSYVHPAILEAYMDGSIGGALLEAAEDQTAPPPTPDLREERQVVALLRERIANDQNKGRKRGERPAREKKPGRCSIRRRSGLGGARPHRPRERESEFRTLPSRAVCPHPPAHRPHEAIRDVEPDPRTGSCRRRHGPFRRQPERSARPARRPASGTTPWSLTRTVTSLAVTSTTTSIGPPDPP